LLELTTKYQLLSNNKKPCNDGGIPFTRFYI